MSFAVSDLAPTLWPVAHGQKYVAISDTQQGKCSDCTMIECTLTQLEHRVIITFLRLSHVTENNIIMSQYMDVITSEKQSQNLKQKCFDNVFWDFCNVIKILISNIFL